MAIPRAREEVPPPLPPPRHIQDLSVGQDPGWQWGNTNSPRDTGFGGNRLATVRPGSSLYGGAATTHAHPRPLSTHHVFRSREPSVSQPFDDMSSENSQEQISDDERSAKSRPSLRDHRFTSERQLGQQALQSSSHAYDKQLLSKIGGPNTPTRANAPPHSNTAQDATDIHVPFQKLNNLKPLSVPDRRNSTHDSPSTKWPPSGAISPGYPSFRNPVFDSHSVDSHRARYGSISTPGPLDETSSQHRGSFDHGVFPEHDFGMDENGLRELNINDRSPESEDYILGPKGGLKRRASSPPSEAAREDRPTTSGQSDLYHRRSVQMLVNRNCAASRFQASHGSVSSASSLGQRTGSIGSSFGFSTAASSMTSYSGDQRLSPNALSPLGEKDPGPVSPYAASRSLNPSPRSSLSRPPQHQQGPSETDQPQSRKMSTESTLHPRHNSIVSRIPGAYICECCPKKPKKFDSEEELRLHELEKQYICQYCPNRFKNKNEAERHQNSLHLRRHSWACAALTSVHSAFHASPTRPTAADVCGYCGEEFPNPADWNARSEHLNHVHKFGECNQAKKFFRADHFRQHLKHSHAGTSGKWTNMLENACMRDEPPLQERVNSIASLSGCLPPKPGVINEVHDES
ncbi:hypothetical protein ACEQ8H_001532 [Pleosporales sp. CAS-2024a]